MNRPDPKLTELYSNEDLYKAKLAGCTGLSNVMGVMFVPPQTRSVAMERMATAMSKTAAMMAQMDVERAKEAANLSGMVTGAKKLLGGAGKAISGVLSSGAKGVATAVKGAPKVPGMPAGVVKKPGTVIAAPNTLPSPPPSGMPKPVSGVVSKPPKEAPLPGRVSGQSMFDGGATRPSAGPVTTPPVTPTELGRLQYNLGKPGAPVPRAPAGASPAAPRIWDAPRSGSSANFDVQTGKALHPRAYQEAMQARAKVRPNVQAPSSAPASKKPGTQTLFNQGVKENVPAPRALSPGQGMASTPAAATGGPAVQPAPAPKPSTQASSATAPAPSAQGTPGASPAASVKDVGKPPTSAQAMVQQPQAQPQPPSVPTPQVQPPVSGTGPTMLSASSPPSQPQPSVQPPTPPPPTPPSTSGAVPTVQPRTVSQGPASTAMGVPPTQPTAVPSPPTSVAGKGYSGAGTVSTKEFDAAQLTARPSVQPPTPSAAGRGYSGAKPVSTGEFNAAQAAAKPSVTGSPAGAAPAGATKPTVQTPTQQFNAVNSRYQNEMPGLQSRQAELNKQMQKLSPADAQGVKGQMLAQEAMQNEQQLRKIQGEYSDAYAAHHGHTPDEARALLEQTRAQTPQSAWGKLKGRAALGALAAAGVGAYGVHQGMGLANTGLQTAGQVLGGEGRHSDMYGTPAGQPPTAVNQYGFPVY